MEHEECLHCKAASYCLEVCGYGSVMCIINRMRTGQTKAETMQIQQPRYCAYCGKPLSVVGKEAFRKNVRCANRYKSV